MLDNSGAGPKERLPHAPSCRASIEPLRTISSLQHTHTMHQTQLDDFLNPACRPTIHVSVNFWKNIRAYFEQHVEAGLFCRWGHDLRFWFNRSLAKIHTHTHTDTKTYCIFFLPYCGFSARVKQISTYHRKRSPGLHLHREEQANRRRFWFDTERALKRNYL